MALEAYFSDFARRDWEIDPPAGQVRIGIIGVGTFARSRALPAIAESAYATATTLVTSSPGAVGDVADAWGIETVIDYDAYRVGTNSDAYDAVYVATPNALHRDHVVVAAEQGKHVLCEKPLATSSTDAEAMVAACADAGVTLLTAYRLRYEPALRRTRELIQDGIIGRVVQIHAGFSHPLLEYTDASTWRLDPALAGGGAMVDLGIYPLNTIRFLLDRDPAEVTAITHGTEAPFDRVDEHIAFQLVFDGPITASCTASFSAHAISGLDIVGTEGAISISAPFGGVVPQEIYVECGDVGMEHRGGPIDEVVEEVDYFGYQVLHGNTPDGTDGLRDVATIEAIYEAADRGTRVAITTPELNLPS